MVRHSALGEVVGLHQGEGWRGHLERRVAGQATQQGAGQRALAGAERAFEQQGVARPQDSGQPLGEALGGGEAVEVQGDPAFVESSHRGAGPSSTVRRGFLEDVPAGGVRSAGRVRRARSSSGSPP